MTRSYLKEIGTIAFDPDVVNEGIAFGQAQADEEGVVTYAPPYDQISAAVWMGIVPEIARGFAMSILRDTAEQFMRMQATPRLLGEFRGALNWRIAQAIDRGELQSNMAYVEQTNAENQERITLENKRRALYGDLIEQLVERVQREYREEGPFHFVDNERVARVGDVEMVELYERQKARGCCGRLDVVVEHAGAKYMVGFNHGH